MHSPTATDQIATRGPRAPRPLSLTPHERLEALCDQGSLEVFRTGVESQQLASGALGDGVVAGVGCVNERPIACFAQDAAVYGGSLGVAHADSIGLVLRLAGRMRLPVVGFIDSAGARMQEGVAALAGYGRIFRQNVSLAHVVPQISIISGVAAGGACYSPALTDFVVMTSHSAMFLTGPGVVSEVTGEAVDGEDLGGSKVHTKNGVCDFVVDDDYAAASLTQNLLSYLPQHVEDSAPRHAPIDAASSDPGGEVPQSSRSVYDIRRVLAAVIDRESLLEIAPRWARNMVTGLARIEGKSVGVVANQPRYHGGVLDTESSQKGARFVDLCDRFNIPLVVFVDTPGFLPGVKQERAGVIGCGAGLVRAFAQANVPRFTVVVRKAYGGAFIAMNSKDLGAELVFAWPQAEIGVMGAQTAVGILHRRELASAGDELTLRDNLAAAYTAEHIGPGKAAAGGFIDEVIEPNETRLRLAGALRAMSGCVR